MYGTLDRPVCVFKEVLKLYVDYKDTKGMNTAAEFDVIVVGGGIAGIAAAVKSARSGLNTLIAEKQINLGGLATTGLISWYEPLCDGEGNQVVCGIAEELIKLSVKYSFDSLEKRWGGTDLSFPRRPRYCTRYSPTVFALALDEYVLSNNVKILFDTYVTYPVMDKKICRGVICENADGRVFFSAKTVIDASGDASLMHRAGVPCIEGKNYMTYIVHGFDTQSAEEFVKSKNMWKFREWQNSGSDMNGKGHPDGMKYFCGTSADEITEFVIEGKRRMLEKIKKKERYSFDIMSIPSMPQLRTIRHIKGKGDFCAEQGKTFSDSIGKCVDFRPDKIGCIYEIPLSSMYNEEYENLICAGRIISAPTFDGWEVARVIPTCALTGEAAGGAVLNYIKHQSFSD